MFRGREKGAKRFCSRRNSQNQFYSRKKYEKFEIKS